MPKDQKRFSGIIDAIHEKKIILLGIFLTLSISFMGSVIYNLVTSEYYTFRTLALQTLLFSLVSSWMIFYLVFKHKEKINSTLDQKLIPAIRELLSSRSGVITFIFTILTLILFIISIFPSAIDYMMPIYQYQITLKPIDKAMGNICIYKIENSSGNLLINNKTVRNYRETGGWEQNINSCALFLQQGQQGEIKFENIGPVDDEIIIQFLKGPDQRDFEIISSFSRFTKTKEFLLYSDEYDIQIQNYFPGYLILRNLSDSALLSSICSILLVFSIILPSSFFKKFTDKLSVFISSILQSLKPLFFKIWETLDQRNVAIPTLFLLFILGVLYSVLRINPMAYGPTHLGDEANYWQTALSLSTGTYSVKEFFRFPPVYPLSLTPAFFFTKPIRTYQAAKFLNSLYLTSAIFPGYLLIRKFEKRNVALLTSTLLLLNPVHVVIPGRILTENIFYPLFLWSVLLAFTNIFPVSRRNRRIECLLLGVSLGSLFLTRHIALVLIPALLLIWWLRQNKNEKPPFFISKEKILCLLLILLPIVLMIGYWVFIGVNEGMRAKEMIGLSIAENSNPAQLTLDRLAVWTILYISYMFIIAAPYITILLASLSEFRIKNWNQEMNRWMIAVMIIVAAFLVACIRHSWKAAYNYPLPQKLQGRYILYFGPLFLITTFAMIRKSISRAVPSRIFIRSSFLVMVSYSILYLGFIFLDKPMRIGGDSPDHEVVLLMGSIFIIYQLVNTLILSGYIKKKSLLQAFTVLFIGFYLIGNTLVINNKSEEAKQLEYSQIYNLLFSNEILYDEITKNEQAPLIISYPSGATRENIADWTTSLDFYRIEDFSFIEDTSLDADPDLILQASCNEITINLINLSEEEFFESENTKYSHGKNYFDFVLVAGDE